MLHVLPQVPAAALVQRDGRGAAAGDAARSHTAEVIADSIVCDALSTFTQGAGCESGSGEQQQQQQWDSDSEADGADQDSALNDDPAPEADRVTHADSALDAGSGPESDISPEDDISAEADTAPSTEADGSPTSVEDLTPDFSDNAVLAQASDKTTDVIDSALIHLTPR